MGDDHSSTDNSILSRPLVKREKQEVAVATVSFLFAATVQYCMSQTRQASELEDKLHEMGVRVGYRVLLLASSREKVLKRELRLVSMLGFISSACWRMLFGRTGELFRSQDNDNEYMINDKHFMLTRYTAPATGDGFINCGAYGAGIIEGILCGAEFPASVAATVGPDPKAGHRSVTFFIRFVPEVLAREKRLSASG